MQDTFPNQDTQPVQNAQQNNSNNSEPTSANVQDNKVFEMSPLEAAGSQQFPEQSFTRSMSKLASQLSLKRDYSVPKNSSLRTVFVMVNTLIGAGCMLLPLVMKDSGIITTVFSLTLIGIISAKTCEMPLMHAEEGERDLPEIIVRLLGDKWYYLYSLSAGLLEILIALAYYLMACNMFYHIMQFICYYANITLTSYDEIEFGSFSYQWFILYYQSLIIFRICIIIFVFFYLLSCMDNFKIVIILNQYGFLCIMSFFIFVIYNLFVNIDKGNLKSSQDKRKKTFIKLLCKFFSLAVDITWFTFDFGYIFGVIAILYLIHPNAVKIFAEHAKQDKNVPTCRWAFLITYLLYFSIGLLGYLGIINVSLPADVSEANTVLDYFEADDLSNLIIASIFFCDLISVFPILLYMGKLLCIQTFWVQYDIKKDKLATRIFDLVFMILSLLLGMFNISPSAVLSVAGAFIGFLLIYIIPIYIHLLCIYQQNFFLVKYSAIYIPSHPFTKIMTEFSPMDENHQIHQQACFTQPDQALKTDQAQCKDDGNMSGIMQNMSVLTFKCKHEGQIQKWMTKTQRYIVYGVIEVIGFAILINQIYELIMG